MPAMTVLSTGLSVDPADVTDGDSRHRGLRIGNARYVNLA